jgi:hypothetical protein
MEAQMRDEMLGLHSYCDIRHNQDSTVVSSTCQPQFTLKEIPWYSFLLKADWNTGLLHAGRR